MLTNASNISNAGYKSEEISVLTTYNGQKHLIRDVVKQRCGDNPVFGFPKTITTVDRYQVYMVESCEDGKLIIRTTSFNKDKYTAVFG